MLANSPIVLSIGEHTEISLESISHYTIGNKEVVASSHLKEKKLLIIKGKSQGYCELYLKKISGKTVKYQISIIKKSKRLKIKSIKNQIEQIGLKAQEKGPHLHVKGEIEKLNSLSTLITLINKYNEIKISSITISKKNRNIHIAEIYKYFWKDNIKDVFCNYNQLVYTCFYKLNKISKNLKSILKELNFLKFVRLENFSPEKVCLIFSMWQSKNNETISKSLQKEDHFVNLTSPSNYLQESFYFGLENLESKNYLLGKKKILLSVGNKARIASGSKVPYESRSQENVGTILKWFFIGFESTISLSKIGTKYSLRIKNEISSRGQDQGYNLDHTSTVINTDKNKETVFFIHNFKNHQSNENSFFPIPFINKLKIFNSTNNSIGQKIVFGTLKIKDQCYGY